jgi:hypothetical protein
MTISAFQSLFFVAHYHKYLKAIAVAFYDRWFYAKANDKSPNKVQLLFSDLSKRY